MSDDDLLSLNIDDIIIERSSNDLKRIEENKSDIISSKRIEQSHSAERDVKNDNSSCISPTDVSLVTQHPKITQKETPNDSLIQIQDYDTRWEFARAVLLKRGEYNDMMTVTDIKANQFMKTRKMILQIESIKKTETGLFCEFSDNTDKIYGTLSNDVVKVYKRCLEVTTVICINNAPILYVTQSGNRYIVVTLDCILSVFSKYDESG